MRIKLRLLTALPAIIALSLLIILAESHFSAAADPTETRSPLDLFSDPKSSEAMALAAAKRLADQKQPPDAAAILTVANSPQYAGERRRRAVLLFWQGHAGAGTTIGEVGAKLSKNNTWLTRENIREIPGLAGKVPVKTRPGSVYCLLIGLPQNERSAIYLRVEGQLREDEFAAILLGQKGAAAGHERILEVGYSLMDSEDSPIADP